MKIEIKCRFSGSVLFTHDVENNSLRLTLEVAVSASANLEGAYLAGANLAGAYLAGANLARAYLASANLARAYLASAYLAGANLEGANLASANLEGANLASANLASANLEGGEKLVGERPIFQLGPIGSRRAYLVAYLTDQGLRLRAGCFFGAEAEFKLKLAESHGDDTTHYYEYKAALEMINIHEDLWAPKPTTDEDD